MVSLRQKRQKTIETLVNWLKSQFPKVLEKLRSKEYWDTEAMGYLSFDELDEYRQFKLMGLHVRQVLTAHIRQNYMFSHATEYNYIKVVMAKVGCVYREGRWFCRLEPKEP